LKATRRSRDYATRRQALNVVATCALQLGRLDDARRYFKQTLDSGSPEDQAHRTAVTLDHLALVEKRLGNYAEALRLSLQSLVQHRQLGDNAGEALCLNNLGSLCIARNEYEAARAYLQQGLAICERDGIVTTRGLIFCNLMDLAMRTGDVTAAQSHADRALEVAHATSNRVLVSWITTNIATLAARRGNIEAARSALADGLSIALDLGMASLKFDAVNCFADVLQAQGEASCARRVLAYAAAHPTANGQVRDQFHRRLAELPNADTESAWPELELDELLHRIVVESKIAHAPLIAALRGAPVRVTS
jgi:tetratricopeptide (TPR) repeat protein